MSSFAINVSQGSSSSDTSLPPLESRVFAAVFLGVVLGVAFLGVILLFFLGGSSSSVSERSDSDSEVASDSASSKGESSSSLSGSKYLLFSLLRVRDGLCCVDCGFLGVAGLDCEVERDARAISLKPLSGDKIDDVDPFRAIKPLSSEVPATWDRYANGRRMLLRML